MENGVAEADYCGLYQTRNPYHYVVVWEEFYPWLLRCAPTACPFPTETWEERAEVLAAFFRTIFLRVRLLHVAACDVKVGLCRHGSDHLHVFLENVVLKEGVSNG